MYLLALLTSHSYPSTFFSRQAIVSSLFPSNVRDRIIKDAEEQAEEDLKAKRAFGYSATPKSRLKTFLDEANENGEQAFDTKPIADLFPETTIMFADIVGFTAWSSVREPCQVFTLLETIYHAFDEIAKRRRVFKVETVGDCYVAVAGLPEPRKDHAVVMARFARDCLTKMNDLTKRLEVTLGPDTADLSIRVGLHSGPVTAGVLRGDKSRFQLFGDTMNTTARIESTGKANHIHVSSDTAALITRAGKQYWLKEREDIVVAKGKGVLLTYWLELRAQSGPSTRSGSTHESDEPSKSGDVDCGILDADDVAAMQSPFTAKANRLIDWNVDVLARLLKQIVARRNAAKEAPIMISTPDTRTRDGKNMLNEVQEIITLPHFDKSNSEAVQDPDSIDLGDVVMTQLRAYVAAIASLYRNNPFHGFEHASHVTMSTVKLLSRIMAPSNINIDTSDTSVSLASTLHDHTYGITSDPLTQFAVVFSALIHDVDHTGVPNTTLVKENAAVAAVYNNKSVAEQNAVDIAWGLLMDSGYNALRATIYSTDTEVERFRQLIVNSVIATDIMDKEASAFRKTRWENAFKSTGNKESDIDAVNRKATIVIEHLIQASDVSHTMQHWHVYIKWNENLFREMYKAYKEGRAEQDPSVNWYKGEIGFFDFYIIPLAKKLKDCGVFGVSSDEYLNYAQRNRQEWERRGMEVIQGFLEKDKSND